MRVYDCILIDDDRWALSDIKTTMPLETVGFRVAGEYTCADDALADMAAVKPSLIISDICMGGTSGLEMIAECRRRGYAAEFIVISGYSDFAYAQQAINEDVCAYVLKPLDCAESERALRKAYARLNGLTNVHEEDRQHTIERVRDYIRKNFDKRLSLDDVADTFFLNRTYLSELFRERFGKTFVQYKNEVRIEHANILLTTTQKSITEIASLCGFDSASYFALVFKQITGISPGSLRT